MVSIRREARKRTRQDQEMKEPEQENRYLERELEKKRSRQEENEKLLEECEERELDYWAMVNARLEENKKLMEKCEDRYWALVDAYHEEVEKLWERVRETRELDYQAKANAFTHLKEESEAATVITALKRSLFPELRLICSCGEVGRMKQRERKPYKQILFGGHSKGMHHIG